MKRRLFLSFFELLNTSGFLVELLLKVKWFVDLLLLLALMGRLSRYFLEFRMVAFRQFLHQVIHALLPGVLSSIAILALRYLLLSIPLQPSTVIRSSTIFDGLHDLLETFEFAARTQIRLSATIRNGEEGAEQKNDANPKDPPTKKWRAPQVRKNAVGSRAKRSNQAAGRPAKTQNSRQFARSAEKKGWAVAQTVVFTGVKRGSGGASEEQGGLRRAPTVGGNRAKQGKSRQSLSDMVMYEKPIKVR